MIKIRNTNWSPLSVALGILILIFLIPYYQKPDITTIYGVLISIYLIVKGISNYKGGVLEIVFGFFLLACVLIWSLTHKLPLLSFETIFFIVVALIFIIGGILTYLSYIPEKWFKFYED